MAAMAQVQRPSARSVLRKTRAFAPSETGPSTSPGDATVVTVVESGLEQDLPLSSDYSDALSWTYSKGSSMSDQAPSFRSYPSASSDPTPSLPTSYSVLSSQPSSLTIAGMPGALIPASVFTTATTAASTSVAGTWANGSTAAGMAPAAPALSVASGGTPSGRARRGAPAAAPPGPPANWSVRLFGVDLVAEKPDMHVPPGSSHSAPHQQGQPEGEEQQQQQMQQQQGNGKPATAAAARAAAGAAAGGGSGSDAARAVVRSPQRFWLGDLFKLLVSWHALRVQPAWVRAVEGLGFSRCGPVQAAGQLADP